MVAGPAKADQAGNRLKLYGKQFKMKKAAGSLPPRPFLLQGLSLGRSTCRCRQSRARQRGLLLYTASGKQRVVKLRKQPLRQKVLQHGGLPPSPSPAGGAAAALAAKQPPCSHTHGLHPLKTLGPQVVYPGQIVSLKSGPAKRRCPQDLLGAGPER